MKLKLVPISIIIYFLLAGILLKAFSIASISFVIAALVIDYFTKLRSGIKNILYLVAAFSPFLTLLYIFLIFLPFAVFGLLLGRRGFITNYIIGFAISFIPTTAIYLISTYLSVHLNLQIIFFIFYFLPIAAFVALKKKSLEQYDLEIRDLVFALIILFFTVYVAIGIVDDKNLFISNGSREFYRIQLGLNGLINSGLIPIYDQGMGMGEASYLWVTPTYITHFVIINLLLKFIHPILFFNSMSLFILLLSTLSIGVLLYSILNKEKSNLIILALSIVTTITGLNFIFLQFLESIKAFYSYPSAHLLLSLILSSPKKFTHYFFIAYIAVLVLMIHSAVGLGVFILAVSLFVLTKLNYFKDLNGVIDFSKWIFSNKFRISIFLLIIILLPLFYISTPIIFKKFLLERPEIKVNYANVKSAAIDFFKGYYGNELNYLSLRYPDINRIDDHKFGFFLSVFGLISLLFLLIMYKIKTIHNLRIFTFGYLLHLIGISLIYVIAFRVGGFFRTPTIYLVVLLGASVLTLICLVNKDYIKVVLIGVVFIALLHSLPYARQNIANIHREQFMSGEVYKEEIDFIRKLPLDGRIMTYGLFDNVVDYGISYSTGRYASRSERIELQIARTPHEKIHGQNSFGEPELVLSKSGEELSNYLKLGGYKYLFLNICHPIGNYVGLNLYPNYSTALYQKDCFVFLLVNDTHYTEKVDLARHVSPDTYKTKNGFRYSTLSSHYDFDYNNATLSENPRNPVSLRFERLSPTKIRIFGDFGDDDWIIFKEQYFSRWRAFMNNEEIPVLASNNELILIKTIKGSNILLEYSVLRIEKVFGILSLVGFLSLAVFIIFLTRKSVLEENIQ